MVASYRARQDTRFRHQDREWEMDTVVILNLPEDGKGIEVRFTKARLRQEYSNPEFAEIKIVRRKSGWEKAGLANQRSGKASDERTHVQRWFLEAYDRLADQVKPERGLDGISMVKKVSIEALRNGMKSRGLLDVDEKTGNVSTQSRNHLRRAKGDLTNCQARDYRVRGVHLALREKNDGGPQ
jgi:hypothetical protein